MKCFQWCKWGLCHMNKRPWSSLVEWDEGSYRSMCLWNVKTKRQFIMNKPRTGPRSAARFKPEVYPRSKLTEDSRTRATRVITRSFGRLAADNNSLLCVHCQINLQSNFPGYRSLKGIIKIGCRAQILGGWLSESNILFHWTQ